MRIPRQPPAYSLLEVTTVVVIIAILATMALPRFGSAVVRQRADATARRIIADLTLARRRARLTGSSQAVSFNTGTDSYQLVGLKDPDHPANDYVLRLRDEPYRAAIILCDFGADTPTKIVFDGYGVPDTGGTVVIQVGSEQRTVAVNPDTGEASLP